MISRPRLHYRDVSKQDPLQLRLLTLKDVEMDTPITELVVSFVGMEEECMEYALSQGFEWKADKYNLFGGYFRCMKEGDSYGECLMVF